MAEQETQKIDMELVRQATEVRVDTFQALGRFIFEFSQLELSIRFVLGRT